MLNTRLPEMMQAYHNSNFIYEIGSTNSRDAVEVLSNERFCCNGHTSKVIPTFNSSQDTVSPTAHAVAAAATAILPNVKIDKTEDGIHQDQQYNLR